MVHTSLQDARMKKKSRFSGFSDSVDIVRKKSSKNIQFEESYGPREVIPQNVRKSYLFLKGLVP